MMSNLKIVHSLDVKVWREFIDQHPQGNIFHTPEMLHVFERANRYQPRLWAAVGDNDQLLALFLPVQVTLGDGIMRRLTARSIAYGGILNALDSRGKEALAVLLGKYAQEISHGALFTELRHLSDPCDIQPVLDHCGYSYEDYLDYLIDVNKSEKEIWQAISKSGRKSIRRFCNKGVIPEEIKDRSYIPIFYSLLKQTYNRIGVPLADISLFEAVFDILVPKGMAKLLLARVDNEYVAASLELPYKDVIYSWYSGYDRAWRAVYPNDGLVWYILKWGAENGYRYYDFGGAGRLNEPYSVRDFKAKFGGKLVNFGRHTCVHAPLTLSVSRVGYQIYSQMIRYMPTRRVDLNNHDP
jgi:serine/alanine adding enzyme